MGLNEYDLQTSLGYFLIKSVPHPTRLPITTMKPQGTLFVYKTMKDAALTVFLFATLAFVPGEAQLLEYNGYDQENAAVSVLAPDSTIVGNGSQLQYSPGAYNILATQSASSTATTDTISATTTFNTSFSAGVESLTFSGTGTTSAQANSASVYGLSADSYDAAYVEFTTDQAMAITAFLTGSQSTDVNGPASLSSGLNFYLLDNSTQTYVFNFSSSGSTTASLVAGHTYIAFTHLESGFSSTGNNTSTPQTLDAQGNFSYSFTAASVSVPEPSVSALFLTGAVLLAMFHRRRIRSGRPSKSLLAHAL
jgi:hypothetical protein